MLLVVSKLMAPVDEICVRTISCREPQQVIWVSLLTYAFVFAFDGGVYHNLPLPRRAILEDNDQLGLGKNGRYPLGRLSLVTLRESNMNVDSLRRDVLGVITQEKHTHATFFLKISGESGIYEQYLEQSVHNNSACDLG